MGESQKIMQVRSARQVPVRVQLLDDDTFNHSVDKRAVGWILFDSVCEHLNILEKDYFGLNYYVNGEKFWLNNDKKIAKQLKGQNWDFHFEVKFYPADPSQLAEDLTRYQLCLQIRRDIVNERLPCSFVTYTLLGSYTAQSELGDYDTEEFGSGYKYLKDIQFAPHQDKELLIKIAELHRQHKGETPEEAELHFLENAKKLAMFGVELHPAKDAEGRDIQLGVCASGLIVYKDKQQINRFVWPKVLKISYRRNKYYIKIRPGEFEEFASLIGFKLANVKFAKRLWKISVEHHSFFRFREPENQKSVSFLPRFGSRFRYSGRTQFQTRQVVAEENRESPFFDRVLSKRGTFGGRTNNMRKRDEERQHRRDELRRAPPQTKLPPHEPRKEPPPEPTRTPPEPKHAPPVAPKPGKPKPSPRGPSSVEDSASLDRRSLNDSFDDVPDRKSRMEKIHAVATPLAALMQAKKEHEQHEEEHHREEAHRHRDDHSDDERRDEHQREKRHRDDHHDDDHDRSYDHEVGNSSKTNQTNQAYKTDRTYSGKGDNYTRVNKNERVRKSKSMGDNLMGTKTLLFSYPASSFESVTSHGDYDANNDCIGGLNGRAESEKFIGSGSKHIQNTESEQVNPSISAEIVYSEIPKNQYDEIGPPKFEGIYAEIDEVKSQVEKLRHKKANSNNIYDEIPNRFETQNLEQPEVKIHGRKSKYFKEKQKSEHSQDKTHIPNQYTSLETKTIKLTQPKKLFHTTNHENEKKDFDEGPCNSKSEHLLQPKPKPSAQMPIYAKINKQRKDCLDKTCKPVSDLTDSIQDSNIELQNLQDSKELKEELKMYILTPEKVNRNFEGLHNTMKSYIKEQEKTNSKTVQHNENINVNSKPLSNPSIIVESSNVEKKLVEKNIVTVETKLNQVDQDESQKSNIGELHSVARNEILETTLQENIIKVLSLSSLEDGESVHNTSSVISDPEQTVNISELEAEGVEMDIRKRVASSSLSSLYKLTFDGNSNNDTESLNLDDEKLEKLSTLSSESNDVDTIAIIIVEGAVDIETGSKQQRLSLDEELERFSTVSTDSSDFENVNESPLNFGSNLEAPSMTRLRQIDKAEVKVKSELDKNVWDQKHVYTKTTSTEADGNNMMKLCSASAEKNLHAKIEECPEVENKVYEKQNTTIKAVRPVAKDSFEIEVYDAEPYSRQRVRPTSIHNDFKSEFFSTNVNRENTDTMDFFQKPKLQDNALYEPIESLSEGDEKIFQETKEKSQEMESKGNISIQLNESLDSNQMDVTETQTIASKREKPEEVLKDQQTATHSESRLPIEIVDNKPESLLGKSFIMEDNDTPVKIIPNIKQHLQIGKETIKKQLFSPTEIKDTFSKTKIPIIEGSKVFVASKKNEETDQNQKQYLNELKCTEDQEMNLPSQNKEKNTFLPYSLNGNQHVTVLKPLYSSKQTKKDEVDDESLPHTYRDHILNDRKEHVEERPSLANFFPADSRSKKPNDERIKGVNNEIQTIGQTFRFKNDDTEQKIEKVPIVIKESKVFSNQKSDKKNSEQSMQEEHSKENNVIIMGNIKPFQGSEPCSEIPQPPESKSEKERNVIKEKNTGIDKKTPSSKLEKSDHVRKETKPSDNLSLESTSSHENEKGVKKKVTPGVIHMLNPCPSGWIEGGIRSSEKQSETKKKEKPSKYTVSVLDFKPQEIPRSKEIFVSSLDSDLTKIKRDEYIKGDKTVHDPKKMLENAQQTDLLCRRVWKKYIRSGKNTNKKENDSDRRDGDNESEGYDLYEEDDNGSLKESVLDHGGILQSKCKDFAVENDDDADKEADIDDENVSYDFEKAKSGLSDEGSKAKKAKGLAENGNHVDNKTRDVTEENGWERGNELLSPLEVQSCVKSSNNINNTKNQNDVESGNSKKPNIEQLSLHSKLESLGLGDVKLDEDALEQQSFEAQQIDFYAEDNSSDSESGPSETDSESGDEIELASFEMPGFVVNPESDDVDGYNNADIMQQFAIDCSFEDVKSYQMENTDQEPDSILCECSFHALEPGQVNSCKLHRSVRDKVPDIIDDTPHVPVRSNLKRKSKSESNLSERRVRFEENLPVYKSSNSLGHRHHLFRKRKSNGNKDDNMKYIEDFITCLFDSEPRNIGLVSTQSNDNILSDPVDENWQIGNDAAFDYFDSTNTDKKLEEDKALFDSNAFVIDQPFKSDMAVSKFKDVSTGNQLDNDSTLDYCNATGTYGLLDNDKKLHETKVSVFNQTVCKNTSNDTVPCDDETSSNESLSNNDGTEDVTTLTDGTMNVGFDEKYSGLDCPSKRSPKIVKPISGRKQRPTLVRVSTQQRTNANIPVMIPITVSNSKSECIKDKVIQFEKKTIPKILLTSPTGKTTGSENVTTGSDHYSCRDNINIDIASSRQGEKSEMNNEVEYKINSDTDDSSENDEKTTDDINIQGPVNLYSSSCVAELKNGKYHEIKKENETNTCNDSFNQVDYRPQYSVQRRSAEHLKEMESKSIKQDLDCAEINPDSTENVNVVFSSQPRDQVTKYTFSVNEDLDTECPKIKTVTYEYVTEYKLNNVKIQYQQNRKTQTDAESIRVHKGEDCQDKIVEDVGVKDKKDIDKGSNQTDSKIIMEEVIEKSVCYPLGPSYSKKDIDKGIIQTDSKIIMEEVIEKSVCYPLGPSHGKPSSDSTTSGEGRNAEEQIEKSITIAAIPERDRKKKTVLPKPSGVLDMQVIEHNSKKYFWQSCQTNIPFRPTVSLPSSKYLYNTDELDEEAKLKKNWTLCDEEDSCVQEAVSKNYEDTDHRFGKNDAITTSIDGGNLCKETERDTNVRTDISTKDELFGNRYNQQETLQGKDRLRQFCRRKLLKRHKNVDDEDFSDSESSDQKVLSFTSDSDKKDGLEFEIGETKKVPDNRRGVGNIPNVGDCANMRLQNKDDGETFLAAVMQERLPELQLHDQSNETMFVVQAVAAIALGTVLVFLLPYVG